MLRDAAENLVRNCMNVRPGDKVFIIADSLTRNAAKQIAKEAGKVLILEDFGARPLKRLPSKLRKKLEDADVVFYVARTLPAEQAFRQELKQAVLKCGRLAYMPDLTYSLLKESAQYHYRSIDMFTKRLSSTLKIARKLRITTGTAKLDVKLSDSRWLLNTGICHEKGAWTSIPAGELSAKLSDANGFVSASMFGGHFARKYGMIEGISMHFRDGKFSHLTGSDSRIINAVTEYLRSGKNMKATRLSMGTNTFMKHPSASFVLNKKMPGIYLTVGSVQLDVLAIGASVEMLEPLRLEIMKDGKYVL